MVTKSLSYKWNNQVGQHDILKDKYAPLLMSKGPFHCTVVYRDVDLKLSST